MANTISVMTNAVRGVVSKKRIRYQENGYDLDLAYVGDKLIAMGYPAENIESIFRNKIEHVYDFLEEKHKDHYKIYNLCSERHYDGNRFHGRVALYPFDDHNPPPIRLIKEFCDDVDAWLKADKENVAAVHCKAGKGRTGTMICCYLLHCRMKTTAESALTFYDEKRTKNKKGVTIPSQRRYVEYYAKLVNSGQPYEDRTLQICGIKISPQLSNQDNIHCSIYPNPRSEDAESIHTTLSFRKTQLIEINDRCIPLTGDVKIEFYRKVMKRKERYFHFWFNTYFICDKAAAYEDGEGEKKFVYELTKYELDDAHKDTEHKTVPQDFKVQLVFKPVEKDYNMTTPSAAPNLASVTNVVNNSNVKSNYANLIPLNQEQNHHHLNYNQSKLPNNVGMNHNNSVLMVNSRPLSSKEPPFARDPVRVSLTDSSTSGSSIGDQQHNRMMMPSQSSSSSSVMMDANCQPNQDQYHQSLQQYQSQKYQQQLNSNSLTNSLTTRKEKFKQLDNYENDNIPLEVNNPQLTLQNCVDSSGKDSTTSTIGAADLRTPSDASRTNSSSRSNSINSGEVSSHSGGSCGEGDWESGESPILSRSKQKLNDEVENEIEIKNDESEDDSTNLMLMAMIDADNCHSTVNVNNKHYSLVSPSSALHSLSQDSSGSELNSRLEDFECTVTGGQNQNVCLNLNSLKRNLANNNNSCNNNNGNNKTSSSCMNINVDDKLNASNLIDTTLSGSASNSCRLISIEKQPQGHWAGGDASLASASSTGCWKPSNNLTKSSKYSNKSLGVHYTISNNYTTKKVHQHKRWLSNMKSDPDLCETLSKSVNFRKTPNYATNSFSSNLLNQQEDTESDSVSCDVRKMKIKADSGDGDSGRGLHYSLINHRLRTNSTSDHDDFYSSLCDTQLSFGGSSPMKSPPNSIDRRRGVESTMRRIKVDGSNISGSSIVVAKPIEKYAIGFKVPESDMTNLIPVHNIDVSDECSPEKEDQVLSDQETTNISPASSLLQGNTISPEFECEAKPQKTNFKVGSPVHNVQFESAKSLVLLSSSPPACKANRCVPFSLRSLGHELQSVLKSKSSKVSSGSAKAGFSNLFNINKTVRKHPSLEQSLAPVKETVSINTTSLTSSSMHKTTSENSSNSIFISAYNSSNTANGNSGRINSNDHGRLYKDGIYDETIKTKENDKIVDK